MDSFIYTPSVKNSAPKPLYTDSEENENEHELALPIIAKSEPFFYPVVRMLDIAHSVTLLHDMVCDVSSVETVENRNKVRQISNGTQ